MSLPISFPTLTVPQLGLPNPISPGSTIDSPSLSVPSLPLPNPSPDPESSSRPPPTTRPPPAPDPPPSSSSSTTRGPTPTVPVVPPSAPSSLSDASSSLSASSASFPTSSLSHVISSSSPQPSRPPSAPESNPSTNDPTTETTTTVPPLEPTGQLSPDQPNMSFLENKSAKAGVFSVVAIVAAAILIGILVLFVQRRKRKQLDIEHNEAMVGYAPRAPIDGDEDYVASHGDSDNTYYNSQKAVGEEIPSTSTDMMQQYPSDSPTYLQPRLVYNSQLQPTEEYNPYREYQDPFVDQHTDQQYLHHSNAGHDEEGEDISEESVYLEPPSPWPTLGQLPRAFGSPGSEITLEFPQRQALRVTNGLDDTHA